MVLKTNGVVPASVPQTTARTGEPPCRPDSSRLRACVWGRDGMNNGPPTAALPIHQPWSTGLRIIGRVMYPTRTWAVSTRHKQRVTTWFTMPNANKAAFRRTFATLCVGHFVEAHRDGSVASRRAPGLHSPVSSVPVGVHPPNATSWIRSASPSTPDQCLVVAELVSARLRVEMNSTTT